jgi:diguanylate cyclase (GGDEF)-like protein/PAS domain S-box-containing protein
MILELSATPLQRRIVLVNLGLALLYFVSAKLSLLLAVPPGFASPFFPASGIAMAAVLTWGWRALPGIGLGALLLNQQVAFERGATLWQSLWWVMPVVIGSLLQAQAGGMLMRRWVQPGMDSAHDALRFLGLGPLACLLSSSVSVPGLYWISGMREADLLLNWLVWWVGDSVGVLVGMPLALIVLGQPRLLWWRRRWLLGLPLCVASGVLIVLYLKTSYWEVQRNSEQFRFKSQQLGDQFQAQFGEYERLLAAMATVLGHHALSEAEFRRLARVYLESRPELRRMGWAPQVTASGRAEFEQWAGRNVMPNFVIREAGTARIPVPAKALPFHYPVTWLEPLMSGDGALGLDFMSEPLRAAAVAQSSKTGRTAATAPLLLFQEKTPKRGILLLQSVRAADPAQPPVAMLSIVLEVGNYLQQTLARAGFAGFVARIDDVTEARTALPVMNDLQRAPRADDYQRQLTLGGRQYLLTLAPTEGYMREHRSWQSWIVMVLGLLLTGLMGQLLLSMSGERAKIEAVVRERTRRLRDREARLQAILDHAADAILTIGMAGELVSANAAASVLFGHELAELEKMTLCQLLRLAENETPGQLLQRLAGQAEAELTGLHRDGRSLPLLLAVSLVDASDEHFYVGILHDLSEQRRSQQRIYELAHHDPLTGLANRFTLNTRLEQLLALSARNQSAVAVMFIDLDHFKKVNDTHGHQIGDSLLIEVAQRLKHVVRDADTIARQGGDEFIVVLGGNVVLGSVQLIAKRILTSLGAPYQVGKLNLHTGASIGVAMFPDDSQDVTTLLLHADTAMYAAKNLGRNNFQFFSEEMNRASRERLLLENRLWLALEQQEFELWLQPQISLADGNVIGAEALLRWQHPELGLVPPDRFIPIAEDSGLMLPLGEWVLQRGIEILARWRDVGLPHLRIALNLSARQCHYDDLLPAIDRLLACHGIATAQLELEVTESAAMHDPEATASLLYQLRSRGIKLAIDDFGTGYSSLSYLKLFALDRLKIDRSFVKDIETDPNDAVIVSATVALAHSLGLEVIAEGVETEAQAQFLRANGCDEAQGYWYGRPMPLAQFEAFVREQPARVGGA